MKKIYFLFVLVIASMQVFGQANQTVTLTTPGTLSHELSANVENLTVKGFMNRTDFETIRSAFQTFCCIATVDLSEAQIVAEDVADGEGNIIHYGADTIPYRAFFGADFMTEVKLPASVSLIESEAFMGTSALEKIELPEGVDALGVRVFNGSGIKNFTANKNLRYIGPGTFQSCPRLETVDLSTSTALVAMGNFMFTSSSVKSVIFPESLVDVEATFLYQCNELTSVDLSRCKNLKGLTHDVTGEGTLDGFVNENLVLKDLDMSGCTSVKALWFGVINNHALETLSLPSSLELLSAGGLLGNSALKSIHLYATTPPALDPSFLDAGAGAFIFNNIPASCTLYVPNESLSEYESSSWADYFLFIQGFVSSPLDKPLHSGEIISKKYYSLTGIYLGESMSDLPDGLYIVQNMYDNGEIETIKTIIKQ